MLAKLAQDSHRKTTPRFKPRTAQMTFCSPFFDMTSVLQLLAISDADEPAKNLFPHPFLRPRWYSERLVSQQADIQENHQRRKKNCKKKNRRCRSFRFFAASVFVFFSLVQNFLGLKKILKQILQLAFKDVHYTNK